MAFTTVSRFVVLAAISVVLWFGLQPEPAANMVANSDKYSHIMAFAILCLAFLFTLPDWPRGFTAIVIFALGLVIELGQAWLLPHRSFEMADLMVNAIGIAIALFLYWLLSILVMAVTSKNTRVRQPKKVYKKA